MRRLRVSLVVLAACSAVSAVAAPVSIQVIGIDGRPIADAVVTLVIPGTPAPAVRGPYIVAQRNIQFAPRILIVPVNASVSFPNFDKVRHHVYSFSKSKKFELKLFGREESRSITFDKSGAIALGCNIHDAMSGVVYVTASPYTAVTDTSGRVRFNVPGAAAATASVWHPAIRAADKMLSQRIAIGASGLATTLQLRR